MLLKSSSALFVLLALSASTYALPGPRSTGSSSASRSSSTSGGRSSSVDPSRTSTDSSTSPTDTPNGPGSDNTEVSNAKVKEICITVDKLPKKVLKSKTGKKLVRLCKEAQSGGTGGGGGDSTGGDPSGPGSSELPGVEYKLSKL
ncbi:hypothetical protein K435DRAFT_969602 [Dendrothele bispora CBS 962.96]|uniref:Uncharacterized protein n=1 Tax=Dendrothele bispora (strain CBS 962.96) TaxID=1314807 RepID=A0A4S8LGL4_DENBC|nr:hypothetical protein K435DRAFT_969602 [Dendrothele bispora CBS 962.96]